MKHEPNAELIRLPTANSVGLARFAIKGAETHLSAIRRILKHEHLPQSEGGAEYVSPLNNSAVVDVLLWRTRAFFWELVGAFDMFLQWANDHFELGLPEHNVMWANMPTKSPRDQAGWDRMRVLLEEGYNSEWYFEIRTYRNFAHRSLLPLTSLVPKLPGETMVFLPHARVGQTHYDDIRVQMEEYINRMLAFGRRLFEHESTAQQDIQADGPASGGPTA